MPAWNDASQAVHSQFLELATALIEGRMDSSAYEDDVRALLGERRLRGGSRGREVGREGLRGMMGGATREWGGQVRRCLTVGTARRDWG